MRPALVRLFAHLVVAALAAGSQAQSGSGGVGDARSAPLPAVAPVRAQHDMVVSIHHDATDAGLEMLRAGGNAVDAAVAVGFALAVVLPAAGNIGGGGFMLVRPGSMKFAGGQAHFLDFREKAPAAAKRDMYLDAHGNVIPKMSTVGAKASGVPGTVAGLVYAEKTYGKLSLYRVMQPAIRLASQGFVLTEEEANTLHSDRLLVSPASHRIFQRDGDFYKAGERLKQPELARTLDHIAANPDDFYRGVMAQQIATFEKENGGLITAADLAAYQVKDREPLVGHYRGLEV
jgi:gamma-glutamyltranspeptidase/glutathione hydrolase